MCLMPDVNSFKWPQENSVHTIFTTKIINQNIEAKRDLNKTVYGVTRTNQELLKFRATHVENKD